MTFDSDTYMPKSKSPKMDDLDYSKSSGFCVVFSAASRRGLLMHTSIS